jgi:hypothetical protein
MYVPPATLIRSAFCLRMYLYVYVILKIDISLSKMKRPVFIVVTACVFCEVGTEILYSFKTSLQRFKVAQSNLYSNA